MASKLTRLKIKINHNIRCSLQIITSFLDVGMSNLHIFIPWKHDYKWKKIYDKKPDGVTIEYSFEYVLFDKGMPVYSSGHHTNQITDRSKELADNATELFFKVMDNYIEEHKYFSFYNWYIKHREKISLWNDVISRWNHVNI